MSARQPEYCGEWHNPGPDGKFGPNTDANCVREPSHDPRLPHAGLGGDPLWFDDDPTANLNDHAGYDEGSERKAYEQGWTDEPHDLGLLRMLAAEHKASPEQLARLERFDNNRPNQRGLFLTQQEWDDLAQMLATWIARSPQSYPVLPAMQRCLDLAERIIEANQP